MSVNQQLFVSLTNIPTPYRLHFYKALSKAFDEQNIELQVWFMADTEPGRYWELHSESFEFVHRFASGLHPLIRDRIFHFNPSFLYSLFNNPPKWLLLSGSWFFPTFLGALLIARMRDTKVVIWNESNLAYIEYSQSLANKLRGKVLELADAYTVPGQWAKEYVSFYAPKSERKPFLCLPNVIDEEKYLSEIKGRRTHKRELRENWGVGAEKRVLLSLTRLEPIKGLEQMLAGWIQSSLTSDAVWLIAGDGSLRRSLQERIQNENLEHSVRLLGHRTEEEVLDLLALSDAFVLPSLGDPYPLAVIEAMFAGLPLLLSDRVGCHPESLEAGNNGLLFDPFQESDVIKNLDNFLTYSLEKWKEMGKYSLHLAKQRFETNAVIQRFVGDVLAL